LQFYSFSGTDDIIGSSNSGLNTFRVRRFDGNHPHWRRRSPRPWRGAGPHPGQSL